MAWKYVQYENGKYRTTDDGGGASSLADLDDVSISSPTKGQVLRYNGSKWENGEPYPFSIVDGKVCITYTT